MKNKKPRRFFGLLCAHEWEHVTNTIDNKGYPRHIQQCIHCYKMRAKRWSV